jgi:hypothetical protein
MSAGAAIALGCLATAAHDRPIQDVRWLALERQLLIIPAVHALPTGLQPGRPVPPSATLEDRSKPTLFHIGDERQLATTFHSFVVDLMRADSGHGDRLLSWIK